MIALRSVGAVALALALCACTTSGARFDPDSVPRIRPGITTQEDVKRIFGGAMSVRTRGSGSSEWRYEYLEEINRDTGMLSRIGVWIAVMTGSRPIYSPVNVSYRNTIVHKLAVEFDRDGVVEDYTYERTDRPTRRVY